MPSINGCERAKWSRRSLFSINRWTYSSALTLFVQKWLTARDLRSTHTHDECQKQDSFYKWLFRLSPVCNQWWTGEEVLRDSSSTWPDQFIVINCCRRAILQWRIDQEGRDRAQMEVKCRTDIHLSFWSSESRSDSRCAQIKFHGPCKEKVLIQCLPGNADDVCLPGWFEDDQRDSTLRNPRFDRLLFYWFSSDHPGKQFGTRCKCPWTNMPFKVFSSVDWMSIDGRSERKLSLLDDDQLIHQSKSFLDGPPHFSTENRTNVCIDSMVSSCSYAKKFVLTQQSKERDERMHK